MSGRLLALGLGLLISAALAWLWPRVIEPPTRHSVAKTLLDDGRPQDAILMFEDRMWRGVAEYESGRYARAAEAFSPAETALEHYNLGTAYAQLGQLGDAIMAYQRVLRLDPNHADARHNLELVLMAANIGAREVSPPQVEFTPRDGGGADGGDETENEGKPNQQPPSQSETANNESEDAEDQAAGSGNTPGNVGDGEAAEGSQAEKIASKPPDATGHETPEGSGSVDLLARESTQAAEILLRLITDDPHKVLRVRLHTAHQNRETQVP